MADLRIALLRFFVVSIAVGLRKSYSRLTYFRVKQAAECKAFCYLCFAKALLR